MSIPEQGSLPRLVIAALRGGAGKTIVSVGIAAALAARGRTVAPFKKGPDYIDAGWLALAAGRPCYNLDTFLLPPERIRTSFCTHAAAADIALIEGNRGLYDASDLEGRTSTAELAKLLAAPVILCADCTKTTRTMAAVVAGMVAFDRGVRIGGVILNHVAGGRHESILRRTIEHFSGVPVVGALPRLERPIFPERHMGLVPTAEHGWAAESIAATAALAAAHVDLEALTALAAAAPPVAGVCRPEPAAALPEVPAAAPTRARIGVVRDAAFQFYYPENIEALAAVGGEVVFVSPLAGGGLPEDIDALYIGGGFPETHAPELAANAAFRRGLRERVEEGLPVYAECGGLMYLGRELVIEGRSYPMAGVLPLAFGLFRRPQGHGYTVAEVEGENPYYPVGTELRGHEFHYSRVLAGSGEARRLVFRMRRGVGIHGDRDGLVYKNVLATYTHIHALGTPGWAPAIVRHAEQYRRRRKSR